MARAVRVHPLLVVAVVVATALLLALPAVADARALRRATVGSFFFAPGTLAINRGDSVRWSWQPGYVPHSVAVRSGPERFQSPTQASGSYTRSFRRRGTFRLYCTVHSNMRMTLVVR